MWKKERKRLKRLNFYVLMGMLKSNTECEKNVDDRNLHIFFT